MPHVAFQGILDTSSHSCDSTSCMFSMEFPAPVGIEEPPLAGGSGGIEGGNDSGYSSFSEPFMSSHFSPYVFDSSVRSKMHVPESEALVQVQVNVVLASNIIHVLIYARQHVMCSCSRYTCTYESK